MFVRFLPKVLVVGAFSILMGCGPEAQQAAPRLIVGGMAKLSGAKRGFFITKGQPTYHDWNAGAGNIVKRLANADANSFHVYEQPKDTRGLFARDKLHVYIGLNYSAREIDGADAETFELITPDGLYAKDVKRVYYLGVPVVEADPTTFEVLLYPFSRDKERAFIGTVRIPSIERKSWRPLRRGYTEDCGIPTEGKSVYVGGWSRDADAIYYGREVVTGIDIPTFEVLGDYYAKDKRNVYSRHYYDKLTIVDGADVATFAVHESENGITFRGADAHDANSQYLRGKVFEAK